MARSSKEFLRLLRRVEEQHEQEIMVWMQEAAGLQIGKESLSEVVPSSPIAPILFSSSGSLASDMKSMAIDPNIVDLVIADEPAVALIDNLIVDTVRMAPQRNGLPKKGQDMSPLLENADPSMKAALKNPDQSNPLSEDQIEDGSATQSAIIPPTEQSQKTVLSSVGRAESQMSMEHVEPEMKRFVLLESWRSCSQVARQHAQQHSKTLSVHDSKRHKSPSGSHLLGRRYQHCCLLAYDRSLKHFIIDPSSSARTIWSIASLVILCYDIAITPPECFIGFHQSPFIDVMRWVCRIFWTADLPLNFITGVFDAGGRLDMRPAAVLVDYMKSWLFFDFALVGSDWVFLGSQETGNTSFLALFRAFRLLRMLRLLRIAKFQQFLGDLLTVAPDVVVGCAELVKVSILNGVLVHVFACIWFAIGGSDHGWATSAEMSSASFALKYQRALYWMLGRVHGTVCSDEPGEALEYAFAILMTCFGFVTMALFVGKMSYTVVSLAENRRSQIKQICRNYLRTRKVSASLQIRLNKYLQHCRKKSFKQEVEQESDMLASLPEFLQIGLHAEVRIPLMVQLRFFREVTQRMLRMLTFEAMACVVAVKPETVFEPDVICTRMLWVESGQLTYTLGGCEHLADLTPRNHAPKVETPLQLEIRQLELSWKSAGRDRFGFDVPSNSREENEYTKDVLTRGSFLSEAALWTEWFHCGDLIADGDVTILALEVSKFISVISKMERCVTLTINYARRYIRKLNQHVQAGGLLSDLLELDVDFEDIHEPSTIFVDTEHLVFLSHFKREAGTEAALMEEDLNKIIREDESHPANCFASPVFLDSEDLIDLSGLRDHVRNSRNLLVLLTKGILSRPWCLVEIVTASRENVNIVPVEIQRPGLEFRYPDEQFYEALGRGETLTPEAVGVLKDEGIELADLTACMRQVFLKIALPFSPHKSTKIRKAELSDILGRCVIQRACDQNNTGYPCMGPRSSIDAVNGRSIN